MALRHFDPFSEQQAPGGPLADAPPEVRGRAADTLFGPPAAQLRLARVRALCAARNVDALCFVGGVDSRDNAGCARALNYLLCGASGADLVSPILCDDTLEDTVLLVYPGGVRIYTTPAAGRRVSRVSAGWVGAELYCLDERSFKNQDLFEEHKMKYFQELVRGFGKIGFALPREVSDVVRGMEVEKWPIIQSFALDEGGRRRFFTMEHEVTDVSPDLEAVYRSVNAHDTAVLLCRQAPMLARHWADACRSVASAVTRLAPSEALGVLDPPPHEPLLTYFQYGAMRRKEELQLWKVAEPQMLAGTATNWHQAAPPPQPPPHDRSPLHCTLEATDPQGPLTVGRTYLLSSGAAPGVEKLGRRSEYTKGIIPVDTKECRPGDVRRLAELYGLLGHTFASLLTELCSGAFGVPGAERRKEAAFASRRFSQVAHQLGVDLTGIDVGKQLSVSAARQDLGPFCSSAGGSSSCEDGVIYLRLHLSGVCSPSSGDLLGGLLYGDTVAIEGSHGGQHVVLTRHIPQWLVLGGLPAERKATLAVRAACDKAAALNSGQPAARRRELGSACPLGEYVCRIEDGGHLFFPCVGFGDSLRLQARVDVFSGGLVCIDESSGACEPLVFEEALARLVLCSPPGLEQPAFAGVFHSAAWQPPLHAAAAQRLSAAGEPVRSPSCAVVLCLQPGTPAKRQFVTEVLPAWRAAAARLGPTVVEEAAEMPKELLEHTEIAAYTTPRERPRPSAAAGMQLYDRVGEYRPFGAGEQPAEDADLLRRREAADLEDRLRRSYSSWNAFRDRRELSDAQHAATAAYGSAPGQQEGLQTPRNLGGPGTPVSEREVVVHAIAGWPGVGKHKIVDQVFNAVSTSAATGRTGSGQQLRVHCLHNTLEEGLDLDATLLYRKLRAVTCQAGGGGRHVAVLNVPGAVPIPLLLHNFAQLHAEQPEVRLASVTVVVGADHLYREHLSNPPFRLLPGIAGQFTAGYVSQFLVQPGSGSVTTSTVAHLLQGVNPVAPVVYDARAAIDNLGLIGAPGGRDEPGLADLGGEAAARARQIALPHPLLHTRASERLQLVHIKYDRLITTKYRISQFAQKLSDPHYSADQQQILRVKARLHAEGQSMQVTVVKAKPYLNRTRTIAHDPVLRHNQEFVFVGLDLDVQALKDLTQLILVSKESIMADPWDTGAKAQVKEKRPLITRESLQDQDIDDINTANQYRRLPENWFFDGINYCYDGVDEELRSQRLRPDIDEIIDEYVSKKNEEIRAHNASIERQLQSERATERTERSEAARPSASYFP
eukprot:TRINITY_DN70069_c0_g1_i1.p1 TRINITY_DN70069_c0_g1~~TRINITY_DN70069_c0_g1_i1.p1  ORF type:complete len:1308 (+),score=359.16 TRINITY_DN70069_c0_g1_i1:78-3926(+)